MSEIKPKPNTSISTEAVSAAKVEAVIEPPATAKITLLKPHRHAGREHQAGVILTLDAETADFLIKNGIAKK